MLETFLITALTFLLILVLGYLFVTQIKARKGGEEKKEFGDQMDRLNQNVTGNLKIILDQLNAVTKQVNEQLKENRETQEGSNKAIGQRLDNAAKVVNDVTAKLAQLEEANKKIYEVGKDISSLQEILRAPKLRGNLGELFLGDLLTQIFPRENFTLQYTFKSGEKVDAAIHLRNDLIVPVDAKFPLENFKKMIEAETDQTKGKARKIFVQDVKKHIDDIAEKYILPDEGTFDFALMYIPAENVYYETIIKETDEESISQYALSKKVIPVSPNSFYIYLQAILLGLKGLQIEKSAQDILAKLGSLRGDFGKFSEDFRLVGTHLDRAHSSYLSTEKRLEKLGDKLFQIEASETGKTPLLEEKK